VFRYADRDVIGYSDECEAGNHGATHSEALLRPVIVAGKPVEEAPSLPVIREYCTAARQRIAPGHRVEYSEKLIEMAEQHRSESHV
jgi:hypothetical protein